VRYQPGTPMANVHLTLMAKAGIDINKFQDSTGQIDEIFEPLPM